MLAEVDHICAVCEWVRDVLLVNGIPADKITLSRQGVPYPITPRRNSRPCRGADTLATCIFRTRGCGEGTWIPRSPLMKARSPPRNVTLDIFAVAQNEMARADLESHRNAVRGDARIRFRPPVRGRTSYGYAGRLRRSVVPSKCLETGPLVVYEAFAAGFRSSVRISGASLNWWTTA